MFGFVCTALCYGLVQGVTEWLPISSTGHLLLLERVLPLPLSAGAKDLELVLVQLSAILAVCVLWRKDLDFLVAQKSKEERKQTLLLWKTILISAIPVAFFGFFFGDAIKAHLRRDTVIAWSLIALGILFLFSDRWFQRNRITQVGAARGFAIGWFQSLALIPGVSRSGASILGAQICGVRREDAARFSFFLAIPAMFGASAFEVCGFLISGAGLSAREWLFLAVSSLCAFAVSLFSLRFLISFVKRRGFFAFGVYRIVLGAIVLIFAAF